MSRKQSLSTAPLPGCLMFNTEFNYCHLCRKSTSISSSVWIIFQKVMKKQAKQTLPITSDEDSSLDEETTAWKPSIYFTYKGKDHKEKGKLLCLFQDYLLIIQTYVLFQGLCRYSESTLNIFSLWGKYAQTQSGKMSPVSPSPDEPSIWQMSH